MSSRNNTPSTRRSSRNPTRRAHDARTGVYRNARKLKRIGMEIRRGDTRHGDYSSVTVWSRGTNDSPSQRFVLTLAEARSLQNFLDSELSVLAR
jgi:hypothetical protein